MRHSLLVLALAASLAPAAQAATPNDHRRIVTLEAQVKALQAELLAMKAQLVAVPQQAPSIAQVPAATSAPASVEAEVDALAADPAAPGSAANTGVDALAAAPGSSGGGGGNAFNPAISIILNGSYAHHSLDPASYARAGFPRAGEGGGPGPNGFSLGESEVSFAANIDDKFYGQLTAAIGSEDGQDHLGIEEAYIETTALPNGLSLRLGRFYSAIGYLNSHHAHTDNFFDRPLPYQAFLGGQYGDDGVQLRWIAPTTTFLEVGAEAFRGQNYPSGGAQNGGLGTRSVFAHVGGSAGSDNEWLAGVSALKTRVAGGADGFSGDANLYLLDATWKWAPQGNFKDGGVTLRGEVMWDRRNGVYAEPADPATVLAWDGQRRGAYLEAVYRFNRTWDAGYRYDRLWGNAALPVGGFDPFRHSAELTWRNSEFSLFRLQLSRDTPAPGATDNAFILQYQTSLGAHGAHKF